MKVREIKKGPFSMYGNPYTQNDPFGFVIRLLGSISCSEVDLTHVTSFFCGNKKEVALHVPVNTYKTTS